MSISISTHILDTSLGRPAGGVELELAQQNAAGAWDVIATEQTNADGRVGGFQIECGPEGGVLRLTFATSAYFERQGIATFYPRVTVEFRVSAADARHHVPLLISPFGYSTYRGS